MDPLRLNNRLCVSIELSSRLVSKQVLLPLQSLTSVFGMGTGGPFAFETLTLKQDLNRFFVLSDLTRFRVGAPSGIRTRDPLIKSQLLYQLS